MLYRNPIFLADSAETATQRADNLSDRVFEIQHFMDQNSIYKMIYHFESLPPPKMIQALANKARELDLTVAIIMDNIYTNFPLSFSDSESEEVINDIVITHAKMEELGRELEQQLNAAFKNKGGSGDPNCIFN